MTSQTTTADTSTIAPSPGDRGGLVAGFARDTGAVFLREMMLVLRDPFSLIFSLLQPLVFLALFAPLLDGVVGAGGVGGASALQWFLPGVVVMICVFGTGMTGSNLLFEIQTGAYERILAAPLSRSSIIVGRSLKEWAPLVVQSLVITLVAVPFGFRLHLAQVLLGVVLLGIFGVGAGALSYTLALLSRSKEWLFWGIQQSVTFPLLLLSGMMLPLETGPEWMRVVSRFNPLTYLVDAERALFAGSFTDPAVAGGVAAAVVTCAVGLTIGVWTIRRVDR